MSSRLRSLGLTTIRLPLPSGPRDPHVPVWVSANLARASRVIVVFGEPIQDLGIWAYRTVGTEGVDAGSAVAFARAILAQRSAAGFKDADTALLLANTGQLIWHCGSSRAVTHQTWLALSRSSAVDPPLTMTRRNKIPSNQDWQEHVACVFDEILSARGRLVREDAKIDIIGLSEGGLGAIRYLAAECMLCLTLPSLCHGCCRNLLTPTHYKGTHGDHTYPPSHCPTLSITPISTSSRRARPCHHRSSLSFPLAAVLTCSPTNLLASPYQAFKNMAAIATRLVRRCIRNASCQRPGEIFLSGWQRCMRTRLTARHISSSRNWMAPLRRPLLGMEIS